MPARRDVSGFIRSTFRSVWALELLCFLRRAPDQECSKTSRSTPRHTNIIDVFNKALKSGVVSKSLFVIR